MRVLDNCRIRWGEVVGVDGAQVMVMSRRLAWDGVRLALAEPAPERVRCDYDGQRFVTEPTAGDCLALHWDTVCERITPDQKGYLQRTTEWQLRMTNARLARELAPATGGGR